MLGVFCDKFHSTRDLYTRLDTAVRLGSSTSEALFRRAAKTGRMQDNHQRLDISLNNPSVADGNGTNNDRDGHIILRSEPWSSRTSSTAS